MLNSLCFHVEKRACMKSNQTFFFFFCNITLETPWGVGGVGTDWWKNEAVVQVKDCKNPNKVLAMEVKGKGHVLGIVD